ncbi:MAG: murein biosynthesis integral membrane protein MurJ [Planctomycetes bacterium]|nr:murein biosynthesis integral membrane protein MurJ [Planctomycetota bacterium]
MTRLIRAASSISAFTLLSRILGLIRDSLMTRALGAGWVQGTFLLAWMLPNLMRRLLGEGALSASMVPAYTRIRQEQGPQAARELLAQVVGTVITLLTPLCLLVAIGSLLLPASVVPEPEKGGAAAAQLLLWLNAILFLYALPVCLTAIWSGVLNTLGSFALPAAVPIALNLFWIAALLLAPILGLVDDQHIAMFTATVLTVGGFAQMAFVVVPLWRRGELLRPRFGLPARGTPAHVVFAAMAPTVLGMSLNQVSSLLDQGMAYWLIAPGAVTYVYLANRLLLFPHALTAMAVAVAVFPRLAAEANVDRAALRGTLDRAAAATIWITLPASFGLIALGEDVVRVLFESAKFTEADVAPTVLTCALLVAGLPFLGLAQLLARAFYAVGDNRTPARLMVWLLPVNVIVNLVLLLTTPLGTAALTLSSSLCALANAIVLRRAIRAHVPDGPGLWSAWARSAIATAAMCLVLPLVRLVPAEASRWARAGGNVAFPIAVGIGIYVLVHLLLRSPELQTLRRRRAPSNGAAGQRD